MMQTKRPDHPVVKRQKVDIDHSRQNGSAGTFRGSRIFAPFRTVGLISPTEVPFTTVPLGKTTFQITTSVGRSLQTYDLRRGLNLVFITRPQTPEIITATSTWKDRTLAAWGGQGQASGRGIWVYKRGKKVDELEMPKDMQENVRQVIVSGSWIVGCCSTVIEVWKSATLEHYTTLVSPFSRQTSSGSFLAGGICNMPTYLNKIFAGRENGCVEIWNISTGKLLYTILPPAADYGAVTALQPAPAISHLAIAYKSGSILIHNVRYDQVLMTLNTGASKKSPITSISFRTDGLGAGDDGRKSGVMATASATNGDVTFWDLNMGGRKMGVLRGAHNPSSMMGDNVSGGTSKVEFLSGQAILMTSGLDNSLKSWIFDETPFSRVPRILHSRAGHAGPVSGLQFLPSDADGADAGGKWLLSASRDRSFWGWSLRRDGQSTELSQGNIRNKAKKMGILSNGLASLDSSMSLEDLKAPRITCMACSLNRDGGMGAAPGSNQIWKTPVKTKGTSETAMTGWESVVTGHEGDKMARTWFWGRKKAGRWAFETGDGGEVTSVAISQCGTFALIGSAAGGIDMYNLQSGIHRQRFPPRLTPTQAKLLKSKEIDRARIGIKDDDQRKFARGEGKHTKPVTGIAVDSVNRTVISCGADGKIKFWDFTTGVLLREIDWYPMTTVTALRYHRPSDLIAFSCDDSSIRIIDIETKKLIRELWGCHGTVTDFSFSNDGRWIIAASPDSIIRVWDLLTGHMIDAIKLNSKCTALAFSNTGEYLATAHDDSVGVHIWSNRTLFTHVPTRHITEAEVTRISAADAPTSSGEGGQGIISTANDKNASQDLESDPDSDIDLAIPSIDDLTTDLTTLSLVPKSRWQNLLHLDEIRQRNKPIEPPKAPEKAPFFLPSLQSAGDNAAPDATTVLTTTVEKGQANSTSRVSRIESLAAARTNTFTTLLAAANASAGYTALLDHLKALPPAQADLAIRGLAGEKELIKFVHALTDLLQKKRDYELGQAWMAVFLRVHGEVVSGDESLRESLRDWKVEQGREAERLGSLVGFCAGVVGWVRGAR
ncbi:Utp21-domain-containing protein [Patellaria atrata CBS 101060]|uniref:Utp21-domain-containing protein n=1 Tax=Patellaria atrata CBS 101060 TaxID=1346257 RepID=A0A9P4SIW3_9PEZI|nr:Utp21-domain-containing protein [Patellaria atrata CBS 101060]